MGVLVQGGVVLESEDVLLAGMRMLIEVAIGRGHGAVDLYMRVETAIGDRLLHRAVGEELPRRCLRWRQVRPRVGVTAVGVASAGRKCVGGHAPSTWE